MKLILLAGAMVGATATSIAAAPMQYTDLAYSDASERNVLDLYVPEGATSAPLVLFVHGGAWLFGDKSAIEQERFGRDRLLDAGYAVGSMNYRLARNDQWPAQQEDMGAVLAYLKENGGDYGYDANRLAIFGESAGAHLALTAGLTFAGDPERSVDAVVSWYGITELEAIDDDREALGIPRNDRGADSPESRLIGGDVALNPEAADAASPLDLLSLVPEGTDLPPFLLMHGEMDTTIPYLQSERMFDALTEADWEAEFILLAEGTHGGGAFADDPQSIASVIDFLDTELRVTPVPLPAALPMMLLGLGALFGLRRRRT